MAESLCCMSVNEKLEGPGEGTCSQWKTDTLSPGYFQPGLISSDLSLNSEITPALDFHPSHGSGTVWTCSSVFSLYSSVDFGRKWMLIHEHVTPNRFYWNAESAFDSEQGL
ncbi:hypothetical protein CCH79_00009141 [Gambusia affinis]|uniref:Uncharacterized protein n=1 Tax=Gambusia affinis TaxID=33528 RepID=A0A315W434_GAMAF|nr:hypothetical protein CCH79_00009141 [Gambusia affinis]